MALVHTQIHVKSQFQHPSPTSLTFKLNNRTVTTSDILAINQNEDALFEIIGGQQSETYTVTSDNSSLISVNAGTASNNRYLKALSHNAETTKIKVDNDTEFTAGPYIYQFETTDGSPYYVDPSVGLIMSATDTNDLFQILGYFDSQTTVFEITSSDTSVFTVSNGLALSNRYLNPVSVGTATLTISGAGIYETIPVIVEASVEATFNEAQGFDDSTKTLTIDSTSQVPTVLQITSVTIGGNSMSLNDLVWNLSSTDCVSFAGGGTSLAINNGPSAPFFATGTEGTTTATITITYDGTSYTVATVTVVSQEISG